MTGTVPQLLADAEAWLGQTPGTLAQPRKVVSETDKKAFDLLYLTLNAIDTKAGTLMRFNGFVSATMALLLNPAMATSLHHKVLFLASFLGAIGAEIACFFIFAVKYRFLRHDGDTGRELASLAAIAERRQSLFWWAWWLTLVATVLLVAGVLANVISTL